MDELTQKEAEAVVKALLRMAAWINQGGLEKLSAVLDNKVSGAIPVRGKDA